MYDLHVTNHQKMGNIFFFANQPTQHFKEMKKNLVSQFFFFLIRHSKDQPTMALPALHVEN